MTSHAEATPPRRPATLLGVLVSRAWPGFSALAADVARLFLYVGIALVALTDLRLLVGVGGIADVFFALALVGLLLSARYWDHLNLLLFKTHGLGLLLFVTGLLIALLRVDDALPDMLELAKFLFATTLTFVVAVVLLTRRRHVTTALGCWVLSAACASLTALLHVQWGDPGASGNARMAGLTHNPNHLGAIAGMAVAAGLALALRSNGLIRILWSAASLLCVAGVMVSASRTGAVTAAGVFIGWIFLSFRLNRDFVSLAAGSCLAAAALAGFLFVEWGGGSDLAGRLASATDPGADGAVQSRLDQYAFLLDHALRHPLVGTGLSGEGSSVYVRSIHNMFLLAVYAGGVISLLGLLIIIGDVMYKAFRTYLRSPDYEIKVLATGLLLGVLGMVLVGLTEPVLYQRQVWVPAALAMALYAVCHRPRQRTRSRKKRRRRRTDSLRESLSSKTGDRHAQGT